MTEQTQEEPVSLQVAPPPSSVYEEETPTMDVIDYSSEDDGVPVIELSEANQPPTLTVNGIEQKAKVMHYAMQEKSPGVANLTRSIQEGKEAAIRDSLAYQQMYKQQDAAMGVIKQLVQSREGQPLSPEEEKTVYDIAQQAGHVDPDTIVEKVWANNYVKELINTPAQLVAKGMAAAPAQAMNTANIATKIVGTQQVALAIKQKYDKMWEDLPMFGYKEGEDGTTNPVDKITAWVRPMLLPLTDDYLIHNAIKGSENFTRSTMPGENLREMKDYMYLLGPERAKPLIEEAAAKIWQTSPTAAMKFVDAMVSYPQDAAVMDNIMGIVEVATFIPAGKVVRGITAEARATQRIMDNSVKVNPEPVKVSPQFVTANEHILFTPEQIKKMENASKQLVRKDREGRTVTTPRPMAPYELEKAAGAFPEEGSYPPSRDFYGHSAGSVGPPRGISESGVKSYSIGDTSKPYKETAQFLSREDAEKLTAGSRVFTNKDGELEISRQVDGKWTPTGEKLTPSNIPSEGLVELNLGSSKNNMGSKYYDSPTTSEPITSIEKRVGTVNEPYQMSPRDISRIKDGTPGYSLSPQLDFAAYREATVKVRQAQRSVDEAQKAFDEGASPGPAKARLQEARQEYEEAVKARDKVSVYNTHPVIARAQQGIRSYMSSGVQALKTAPTGSGTEIRVDLQSTLTTLGRAEEAVKTGAIRQAADRLNVNPPDPAEAVVSAGKDLPSTHRPNPAEPNEAALSREGALRASEEIVHNPDLIARNQALLDEAAAGQRVQRLTEEDLLKAEIATRKALAEKYNSDFNNSVLDQEMIYNPEQNVYYVKTRLGKTDGTGWADEYSARNTMLMQYGIKPEYGVTVTQQGNSFYGFILTPLDERGVVSLKTMSIPTNNLTPSFFGDTSSWFYKLKSSADTTSLLQMQARHTATHAPQRVNKIIEEVANSVKLTREENVQLARMLKESELDKDAAGNSGKWWDTAKLEMEFAHTYGKLPTQNIIDGYKTYKQLMDFDYTLRSNYIYAYWTRMGMENWTIKIGDQTSDAFLGKVVDEIGYSKVRNKGILFIDEDGTASLKWSETHIRGNMDGFKDKLKDLIDNYGYQIIQLGEPLKKPLKNLRGDDAYYVITKSGDRTALDPTKMLPYREGPHVAYTHPHFIGQPLLTIDSKGQPNYAGDQIFRSGGSSSAEGKAWALKYDTARKLMNDGDDAILADYLKDNLPESVDEFKKLFTGENALNRDMPIAYHSHGKNIFNENPDLMVGTYGGVKYEFGQMKQYIDDFSDPAGGLNSGFVQDRANQQLMVPKDFGNVGPKRFQLEGAATLDPFIALNRGLRQANRVHFMEDYKILASESFIKEFGRYMDGATDEALQRNPVHWLYNAQIDSGTPQAVKNRIMATRENVKNFIGMQSDLSMDLAYYEAKMQDLMYKVMGSEKTAKYLEVPWVQESLIPTIKDPAAFARAVAFKVRMGIFNPVQYWQQGQNVATIMMISPKAGSEGAAIASYLQAGGRYALDDPAKLDYYAGMIAKSSRWTKDEAKEVLTHYKQSGIGIVGSESASKTNEFGDPKMFKKSWIDKGDIFFNAGEGLSRDTAYFTAFREWKDANIGQTPSQYDLGEILRRTNDLTFNMTRASNSSLQSNTFLSIPLQFQTFRLRQMELMLGAAKGSITGNKGRITGMEAGRMLMGYMTLYGIPTGLSAGVGVYNFYDDIRLAAKERGYNLDNPYFKAMHEGVLALAVHAATGKNVNIASAWGPGASNIGNDLWASATGAENSKSFAELLTGPVGGTIQNAIFASKPVYRWAMGKINGDDYPLQVEDYMRFASLTTTTNNARQWWEAHNLQKEFTKSGTLIGSATSWDGFIKFTFGLSNRDYQDSFLKAKNSSQIRGWQEDGKKELRVIYQKMFQAELDGESEQAQELSIKARVLVKRFDLTPEEATQVMLQTGTTGLHERVNDKLYKDPRASVRQKNMNEVLGTGEQ